MTRSPFQAVFLRELKAYFNAPIAYVFIIAFVLVLNGLFMTQFFLVNEASMRYFFTLLPVLLCVFIPAVTMRIWAEEKRTGTYELLLTLPLASRHVVLAKFAAALAFYLLTIAATLMVPLTVLMAGNPDPGAMLGGYLGAVLLGFFFLALGQFISGLCSDQIVAFILAMLACFFFYLTGLDTIAELIDGWIPGLGGWLQTNVGMTTHFNAFERGVVDLRDVLYFLIMGSLFLVLNMFAVEDRLRPRAKVLFQAAIAICLAIGATLNFLLSDLPLPRFDLTQDRLYTISAPTRRFLKSLDAPVTVEVYITPPDKMPAPLKSLQRDLADRLEELRIAGQGRFHYKIFSMEPTPQGLDTGAARIGDRLQHEGITPFQVQTIRHDQMDIKLIYSALTVSYKDKPKKVIPRIVREDLPDLESLLMSRIYRLTLEKTPRIALLLPEDGKSVTPPKSPASPRLEPRPVVNKHFTTIEGALKDAGYDVRTIRLSRTEPLPKETDTLMVLAPVRLNERQLYEINRFLRNGGRVFIAAQSYTFSYQFTSRGLSITPQPLNTGMAELLAAYGLGIGTDLLMDESQRVLNARDTSIGALSRPIPIKAPIHIILRGEGINKDSPMTARLSQLLYLWGAAIEIDEPRLHKLGLKATVLLRSSARSWTVTPEGRPLRRQELIWTAAVPKPRLPLAVLVEGTFPDAFADEAPPPWPGEDAGKIEPSTKPDAHPSSSRLLLIGSAKMFEDSIIPIQPANLTFALDAVDALTLGEGLPDIHRHTPVTRVVRPLNAGERLGFRFLTLGLIPLIVAGAGCLRFYLRRRDKEEYLSEMDISMD